jgi:uncharacterized membrane protein
MATLTAWKFPTPHGAELISTNLSDEQEAKLREAFGLEA